MQPEYSPLHTSHTRDQGYGDYYEKALLPDRHNPRYTFV